MPDKAAEELEAILDRFVSKHWSTDIATVGLSKTRGGRDAILVLILEGTSPKLPKRFEGLKVLTKTTPSRPSTNW